MLRRMVPLAAAIVLVIGCNKPDVATTEGEAVPSGPPITITRRDDQPGDKLIVKETKNATVTLKGSSPKESHTKTATKEETFEFTETILEKPANAARPTKVEQAYKTAESSEDGKKAKPTSYAKKTVLIEKKGSGYIYTANGVPLPLQEVMRFNGYFEGAEAFKNTDFLPKKAVQVNEIWQLDPEVVKKIGKGFNVPINMEKSKGTGRLTRSYTKDGHQWGVLEIKVDFVFEGDAGGEAISGSLNMTITFDMPIDGSSSESVKKVKTNGTITQKKPNGVELETKLDVSEEIIRSLAK